MASMALEGRGRAPCFCHIFLHLLLDDTRIFYSCLLYCEHMDSEWRSSDHSYQGGFFAELLIILILCIVVKEFYGMILPL